MFNFLDRQILAILLPAIRQEFQASDTVLGLLAGTAFALFYVTLGIPIARLSDRFNRRNMLALALAIWSGMTVLCGQAANIVQLTLARIGVGIGEAGGSPPAHSMISDLYPPSERATAMGIYTMGISAGIMLAYVAGGWVVENIGWREAFFIVGAPGLLLALLVRFTLSEPVRGASESRSDSGETLAFSDVLRFLLGCRSFLHMSFAAGLMSFVGYAVAVFFPSFMDRSFGMSMLQAGVWLGIILGLSGGAGYFAGGYLSDRISRAGARRGPIFIAAMVLLSCVLLVGVFLAPSPFWCFVLFVLPAFFSNMYLPPTFAQAQSVVALRMRALASAMCLFIINIVGLALGPPLVGLLSDWLAADYGNESLRYSLLACAVVIMPWAALHFWLASRHVESDLARASTAD
ncbi:MAG: MFS transporter [Pseudomonadota bacterium]